MRYEDFRSKVKDLPLISSSYLRLMFADDAGLKTQLLRWSQAGKLIRLRKNIYILNNDDRKINPSRLFIASELYKPSYVSMEYILSFYGLIPEKVADITSITSKKTAAFENIFGKFVYQHIKLNCFTGFRGLKDEAGLTCYMATPEKAVVDFIYLNQNRFKGNFRQVLFESFRFQNTEILDRKKLTEYANLFASAKVKAIIKEVKK